MREETKICQNCKKEFLIEPEDFDFYKKIQVPPPTWCPECRLIRRLVFRNEKTLYKRVSDKSGKIIFSLFSPDKPFKVWHHDEWITDEWDPMEYGRNYDFSAPFFEQFFQLMLNVPWPHGSIQNLIRSEYCNNATGLKDCYLVFGSANVENSFYSTSLSDCKDCFDSTNLTDCEMNYESFYNRRCYRGFFSSHCEESHDIFFCIDCVGVSNCFGCVGLRNKSFYIFNKPYSKEEYFRQLNTFDLGSFKNIKKLKEQVEGFRLRFPFKYMKGRHNINVIGDYISNSKNIVYSYHINNGENLKFCLWHELGKGSKDCFDHTRSWLGSELTYECSVCGNNNYRLKFCYQCFPNCKDLTYCMWCHSCSNLFGCFGLRNKQYCILNKQYTKEEYERLVPKIIEHMNKMPYIDKKGRVYKYGEFFPPELSPFSYNETIAQEYFPLTKEKALEKGYKWKDEEQRYYKPDLKTEDLPDHIKDVKDDILGKIIQCAHAKLNKDGILKATCNENCTTAFKIIEPELQFYRKMNLPLPRLCPNCRHFQRIKQRNPLKLWKRKCMCEGKTSINGKYKNTTEHFHGSNPCPNEFETSYSPDRPEIVYCEQCYNSEVV